MRPCAASVVYATDLSESHDSFASSEHAATSNRSIPNSLGVLILIIDVVSAGFHLIVVLRFRHSDAPMIHRDLTPRYHNTL
jgi:hypothetical protein